MLLQYHREHDVEMLVEGLHSSRSRMRLLFTLDNEPAAQSCGVAMLCLLFLLALKYSQDLWTNERLDLLLPFDSNPRGSKLLIFTCNQDADAWGGP